MSTVADQRMAALERANGTRSENGRTLASIRAANFIDGIDAVIAILRDEASAVIGAAPIRRLLLAPRRMGEIKVAMLLKAAGIGTGDRRLCDLTLRQRAVLVQHLECPEDLWPSSSIPQLRREREAL